MGPKKNLGFIMPIIAENVFTIVIGLVLSTFISKIDGTALAVVGLSNTAISIVTAAFAMLTNGATVLVARLVGARDRKGASEIIEQTLILAVITGVAAAGLLAAASPFLIKIIMPSPDAALVRSASSFFRILILSFPPLLVYLTLTSVMRSAGSSVISMAAAFIINGGHLAFSYIFVIRCGMGLWGLGLSYIISRCVGAASISAAVFFDKRHFDVNPRNLIKPNPKDFARIFRVGFPTSVESIVLQTGYLIANSMVISMGAVNASIFQITETFYSFIGLPQNICSIISTVYVGQFIGAGEKDKTNRTIRSLLAAGMVSSLIIALPLALLGPRATSIYSGDAAVVAGSARMLWITFALFVPAVSINIVDPALRSGGDTRFTMANTVTGVLAIRIPLTFILGGLFGLSGIYWANIISLIFRTATGWLRYRSGKWVVEDI